MNIVGSSVVGLVGSASGVRTPSQVRGAVKISHRDSNSTSVPGVCETHNIPSGSAQESLVEMISQTCCPANSVLSISQPLL